MLAYRTGLRIGEILGLRLRDLVMIELDPKTIGNEEYYYLTASNPQFIKILIHNNYHRQVKTTNAKRGICLDELLTECELNEFKTTYSNFTKLEILFYSTQFWEKDYFTKRVATNT